MALSRFTEIELLNSSLTVIDRGSLIRVKSLSEGILAMMNAKYRRSDDIPQLHFGNLSAPNDEEVDPIYTLPEYLTPDEESIILQNAILTNVGIKPAYKYFYTLTETSTIYALSIDNQNVQTTNQIVYITKFISENNELEIRLESQSQAKDTNFLLLLIQGNESIDNFSEYIHDTSINPHSFKSAILSWEEVHNYYSSKLIDNGELLQSEINLFDSLGEEFNVDTWNNPGLEIVNGDCLIFNNICYGKLD
jgi:hypothetical protein